MREVESSRALNDWVGYSFTSGDPKYTRYNRRRNIGEKPMNMLRPLRLGAP